MAQPTICHGGSSERRTPVISDLPCDGRHLYWSRLAIRIQADAVQIQSTWFPLIDRNPQTFVDIYTAKETDFRKSTQRVYRTAELRSCLMVPVLPGG